MLALTTMLAVPRTPTPVSAEPIEPGKQWVKTSDDSVIAADVWRAITETETGHFQAITNGDGFYAQFRNLAEFTIRLVTSSQGNIETYRANLQQTANEITSQSGVFVTVAAGTVAGPPDPMHIDPPPGEIYVVISSSSGCGTLSGGALGCGGTDDHAVVGGEFRATSGVVWLSPTMQAKCQQPVTSHEVGHALGLNHFPAQYLGQYQVMKPSTNCSFPIAFQAGDINGLRFTAEGSAFGDNVAAADTVCPYRDTTLDASTWFATTEAGEPAHAGAGPRRSVWYRFTALVNGPTIVKTVNTSPGTFDTVLAVYTGSMFGGVVPITSNDNDIGTNSKVTFNATNSITYWIAVDGVGGSRGDTDVVFDVTPAALPTPPVAGVPVRLMDTRRAGQTVDCLDQGLGRLSGGATYQLQVAGRSWVDPNATSVVLNVTAVSPSAAGYLTVFPCGAGSPPTASNLNFAAGDVIPNLVIAKVGAGGKVCFFSSATTDLLVDISGQFLAAGPLTSLGTPGRLLDTRSGGQTADGLHAAVGRLAANVPYELPVGGRASLPPSPTTVVLNVTAVSPSGGGYVTVYPCGAPIPNASNLNFSAAEVIPNLVIAKVGTGTKVCFVSSVETDLLVDVSGSFATAPPMNALTPARLLDTRQPAGATVDDLHEAVGRIAAGATYTLPVNNRGGVNANPVTVVLNVTAVIPSAGGYLTVYPCDQPQPNASNLNFAAGDVIPNSVIAKVSATGTVCIFSSVETDLLVDVSGFFTS